MKSIYRSASFFTKISIGFSLISKVLAVCQLISEEYRFFAYRHIRAYSSKTTKAFCYLTGRSRGYVSFYAVSRLCFKNYAMHGEYVGLRKFVW
jgi:ribosomal protein S14